ncbi:hypothetical protein [Aquabacterium sp.]|uniref:hypothetical protein n=1 Tax=Aquabacterium sp. TaxID=1872578 RepID=UPI0019BEB390|nr:hypothetical protein [Aquabacterium sp.]MBC7699698.1 hypothetical protein [Aquabacterium sp.]
MNKTVCSAALVAALVLGGCAGIPQYTQVGAPREAELQKMGPPTASYVDATGTRLQYSYGAWGRQTYNIDIDASGRVAAVTQALQPSVLNSLSGRELSSADFRRELGPPSEVGQIGSFGGDVWTWRYWEAGTPRLFHAYVDKQGMVVRTLSTDEPVRPWVGD